MNAKLADAKWLRLLLVMVLGGIVAFSGCTFRGDADDGDDDDGGVTVSGDNDDDDDGEVRGEGSPGLAWLGALGALGGVAYFAGRRRN